MIDTKSFSVMWIANLFSQSVGDCLSLCGVFCYLKVFNYYWSWVIDTWGFIILLSLFLCNFENYPNKKICKNL